MTVANPLEKIEPRTGSEALADTTRYMTSLIPRAKVIELVESMRPVDIVMTVRGQVAEPPLSPLETQLATTVDHYGAMFGSHIGAVGLLEGLRQEVLDGGVFVGEPLPESHYTAQTS